MDSFLEISWIIAIATLVAFLMQRLRQPLILGHIITGIIVGPLLLNLIRSDGTIDIFSKLGIAALLFIVGLNLSPKVMREVGKVSVVAGIGQIVFTSIIGYFIAIALGYSPLVSLYLGVALTFSSTIIVTKLLSDKKQQTQLYGKISIGILLVQDVVAMVIFIVASSFGKGLGLADIVAASVVKGVLIAAILVLFSITILPIITKMFARSQEFLFLFSIGWGFGLASLFHAIGLSMEIGALAAGISLASSPYHYEISAKVKVLRDFFIIMFFILLGSHLHVQNIFLLMKPTLVFSAFVLIGNPLIVMILMGLLRYNKKVGFLTGLTVAQISEFSLILIFLGIQAGHLPPEILTLVTFIALMTISLSTAMILDAEGIYRMVAPLLSVFERRRLILTRTKKESYDVILFGCHRVGQDFLATLQQSDKKFLVVDFDPSIISDLEARRVPCRYGDIEDNEFLEELDFTRAKMVVCTIPDFEVASSLLSMVRKQNAKTVFIAVSHTIDQAILLYNQGASYVILPHFLGGNYASQLFEKHGLSPERFGKEGEKHLEHLVARTLEQTGSRSSKKPKKQPA